MNYTTNNPLKHKCIVARYFLRMALYGILLLILPLAISARDTPQCHYGLVPDTWTPSLNQVGENLTELYETEAQLSQQALNQLSQDLVDIRDAQLFITYIILTQTIDNLGRAQLFDEQKRWLAKRDELARAAVVSKGGSLAPLEYSGAFRKITEERIAELQDRLQQSTSTIQKK